MTDTYKELVYRYRVVRHEELPEEHKSILRGAGINPDDKWDLVCSFREKEDARRCIWQEQATAGRFQTYALIDEGHSTRIDRR